MVVRISGNGQFDLDEAGVAKLHQIDVELTAALHQSDEKRFHALLHEMIQFVLKNGSEVPHDRLVPSDVIVPPEDVSMEEAKAFFHDEGLLEPVPA